MTGRPTIYDVAKEAGVAASTVSRAYSRPGRVNAGTAQSIFEAAERLGYRTGPANGATRVSKRSTNAIGLVVADVTNPFYGEIIKGAYEAAREAGFALVLSHTDESARIERTTIEEELDRVDGVVVASSRMSDSALRMIAKQKAFVLLNRIIPEVSCVATDNGRGAGLAAEHLALLGHEGICYLSGPEASWSDGIRWRGLREAGLLLSVDVRRIGPNQPTVMAGYEAAGRVAATGATAVVAYNDQLAIGLMKGLRGLRVQVPDDISVVGFDNIIFDEIVEPALTTVAAPLHLMGATGVRNCIAVSRGAQPSGEPLIVPVQLVERASTGYRRRNSTSPARGTTRMSGSVSAAARSMEAGSR